jgi:hypothetical protein
MNATKVVENHFESAKKEIIAALETRMVFLLTTIKEIETQDLEPLTSLKQQLDGDFATMKNSIQEGSFNLLLSCNAPYFIISPSLMTDDSILVKRRVVPFNGLTELSATVFCKLFVSCLSHFGNKWNASPNQEETSICS